MFLVFIVASQGNFFAFSLASRAVRATADPVTPSSLRVAALNPEDRGPWGLVLIEWSGMLLPLALPAATSVILILTGKQGGRFEPLPTVSLALFFFIGFLPAQTQYALRFGARASDWAADPALSRQYRAYLGLMGTLVFGNIILSGCLLLLFPIKYYFGFVFPAWTFVYYALFRVRGWLKRHLAESSCDPMADTCWKWGWYYFNPDDPALIVPGRTDLGWSPNFARRPIWMGWVVVTLATMVGLTFIFRMTAHSM
jgi:hypothetical protein